MYSGISLEVREKKAKDYKEGFERIQSMLDSLLALQEMIVSIKGETLEFSTVGRNGLASVLGALSREGWDGLKKMPLVYEFRDLVGVEKPWAYPHEEQEEGTPPLS